MTIPRPFVALPTIRAPPPRPAGRGMVMAKVNFPPRCVYGRWRYGHDGHRNDQPFDRRQLDRQRDRRRRRHGVVPRRGAPAGAAAAPRPADPPRALTVRPPTTQDGAAMWRLARDSGSLDLNSSYA